MKKKAARVWKRVLLITAIVLAVIVGAGTVYVLDDYPALEDVQAVMEQEPGVTVTEYDQWITYGEEDAAEAFLFYPGAKVDEKAYAPLMARIAKKGYFCVVVKMPLKLAVLDSGAADDVFAAYPQIDRWIMGGHSLGGAMAASYAAGQQEKVSGLVLLAAYSAEPLPPDLPVLLIYGSEDRVLNSEKYEQSKVNLPPDAQEVVIEGGNHAGFGWYGRQKGDGEASITPEEQWRKTAEEISAWG